MLFSVLKHYLDLYISDTVLKVSQSLYCFTTSMCHGDENFFLRLWGMGISDDIFCYITMFFLRACYCNNTCNNFSFLLCVKTGGFYKADRVISNEL